MQTNEPSDGTDPEDPVAAQIRAVLQWRQDGAADPDRDGRRQRQPVNDRLIASRHGAPAAHAVLAHPDPDVLAELEHHLPEAEVVPIIRAHRLPRALPTAADLVFFHATAPHAARQAAADVRLTLPTVLLGVQVAEVSDRSALVGIGARAVFSDRIPARDVAAGLLSCLRGERESVILL